MLQVRVDPQQHLNAGSIRMGINAGRRRQQGELVDTGAVLQLIAVRTMHSVRCQAKGMQGVRGRRGTMQASEREGGIMSQTVGMQIGHGISKHIQDALRPDKNTMIIEVRARLHKGATEFIVTMIPSEPIVRAVFSAPSDQPREHKAWAKGSRYLTANFGQSVYEYTSDGECVRVVTKGGENKPTNSNSCKGFADVVNEGYASEITKAEFDRSVDRLTGRAG